MTGSDLDSALAALGREPAERSGPCGDSQTRTNKRAALGLALIGLIVAAVFQLASPESAVRDPNRDSRAAKVFANAQTGTCLDWPPNEPDKPSFVQCTSDHVFEVASSVPMNEFAQPCQRAVSEYLGPRYDPNSRFTSSVLWAGDAAAKPEDRNLLCGLQLLGPGGVPVPFTGQVAELDQSRVWPPGTCLGAASADDPVTPSADAPVDCAQPHAAEVAGAVNVGERLGEAYPADAAQEALLREECTRIADAYLAPGGLSTAGLVAAFVPVARVSWAAGSRQVSCNVSRAAGPEWQPLVGRFGRQDAGPAPAAPPPATPSSTTAAPATPAPTAVPPASAATPAPEPSAPAPTSSSAPAPSAPPSSTESPAPTSSSVPSSSVPTSSVPQPAPAEPPLGPPPGPPASEIPPEPTEPPPNVLQIPGLAPITLPFPAPAPAPAG